MLEHIAIDITEPDVEDFYIEILGAEIINVFTLKKELAHAIFNFPDATRVYLLKINNLVIELFVNKSTAQCRFHHICLSLHNAKAIFLKAEANKYWTYLKETKRGKTYFIKDNNENIFELKSKI